MKTKRSTTKCLATIFSQSAMILSAIVAVMSLLVLILPTLAVGQQAGNFPVAICLDGLYLRQMINVRDGEWETMINRPVARFTAKTLLANGQTFSYRLTTQIAATEQVVPVGTLNIGGVEFGGSQESEKTSVAIDYVSGCDHEIVFTGLVANASFPLQPIIMAKWATVNITATGEIDGEIVTASEQFRRTFWAFGASFRHVTPYATAELRGVVGDKYSRFDGAASGTVTRNLSLRLGGLYEHEDFGDLKIRNIGWFIGGEVRF